MITVVHYTQRVSSVTISSNDNPEGVFFISNSTGPFFINVSAVYNIKVLLLSFQFSLQETDSDFLTIFVERQGGSLTLEQIQYRIMPSSE